jgi:uncharacterized protein YukE
MGDVLEGTLSSYKRDIAAADWVARNFFQGVPDALIPSKLLDATLKIKPDIMFARADKIHTLARIYKDSILDESRDKYAQMQDSWAGEGANTFHYVWQRTDRYVQALADKATEHAKRCTEAGTAMNELRTACAEAVTAHLAGLYEVQKEYADAVKSSFSDLWNGLAGDPAQLLELLTDGVANFWRLCMEVAGQKAEIYQKSIAVATAVDAVPIIDTQQFAKAADPNIADFGDYSDGWTPEEVDGKPWDSGSGPE